MKACRWPGCMRWASLIHDEGGAVGLCFFDFKRATGLIPLEDRKTGRIVLPEPKPSTVGISPASVLSDEQLELADMLQSLGAPDAVVKHALAKQLHEVT